MPTNMHEETVAKVVRAERFEVVDAKGRVRALLDVTDGNPYLGLYDENGKARAGLALLPDGRAGLAIIGEDGKVLWSIP